MLCMCHKPGAHDLTEGVHWPLAPHVYNAKVGVVTSPDNLYPGLHVTLATVLYDVFVVLVTVIPSHTGNG